MNVINKLLGNPLIIGLILVAIMCFMTLPLIIQLGKSYKWLYFGCIMLTYLLLVPLVLVLSDCCRCAPKISGGRPSTTSDFSEVFNVREIYNQF